MASPNVRWPKSSYLCVAPPPVTPTAPPAGPAYLLGHLKAHGCDEFDFVDLRLGISDCYAPTWSYAGAFAESYVLDIPDLPLVLQVIRAFSEGSQAPICEGAIFERYCIERAMSPERLSNYLKETIRYIISSLDQIPAIRFIGFTTWNTNFLQTLICAFYLKRRAPAPFIMVGGPQVTSSIASRELGLRSRLFDLVALGEGEETLLEAYELFSKTGHVGSSIPGTARLDSSGKMVTEPRRLLRMKDLASPSFDEMRIHEYQKEQECTVLPLQFSRGCTDKCSFCSEWVFWQSFRPSDVERTIGEIQRMKKRYGASFILFVDSLLNGAPQRLIDLSERLIQKSMGIEWASFMRANMDTSTAKLLSRAGCHDVFVGIESFSEETLLMMNKRRTKADNLIALEAFVQAGIDVTAGLIPGFPKDSREGFLASVATLSEMQKKYPGRIEVQEEPFVVQAGAPIYEQLEEFGLSPIYWASDILDMMPEYRDITDNVICSVVGSNQGLERLGRFGIVQGMSADTPKNSGFTFIRSEESQLSNKSFDIIHLTNQWSASCLKSIYGHIYMLIVSEEEIAEIDDVEINSVWRDGKGICAALRKIERKHIVYIPYNKVQSCGNVYAGTAPLSDEMLCISPYVVARWISHGTRAEICVFNSNTQLYEIVGGRYAKVIELLKGGKINLEQLRKKCDALGLSKSKRSFIRMIERLVRGGIVSQIRA